MKVDQEVLTVLSNCQIKGNQVKIISQLERKLYEKTNQVLEAAGGRWNRKAKAHVFEGDAGDAMDQVLNTGEITTPQELGSFFTPLAVVHQLIDMSFVKVGMVVLEPSAGVGNIACEVVKITGMVNCIEINDAYCNLLRQIKLPLNVLQDDFLQVPPVAIFDRVIMNPPFAKQADIDHVTHAFRFLKPGGRLISIMSAGVTFRENRKTQEFRNLITDHSGGIQRLPDGSFKESGTMVSTVIVEIPN